MEEGEGIMSPSCGHSYRVTTIASLITLHVDVKKS